MTYLEWNKKILDHYFNNAIQNDFFVLNATTDLINELGNDIESPVSDFISALKVGPIDIKNLERYDKIFPQNFNLIDKAIRLNEIWRFKHQKENQFIPRGSNCFISRWIEDYPPFIAYLFYLVHKVEKDESKYWNSINNEIGKPNIGSNDGTNVIKLFEEFKKFSKEEHEKNFYFANIYSGGGRKYVGAIYSQLPLTFDEKSKISLFFSECGILKDDVEQLGNQELIDLVANVGLTFFEKPTIDTLKRNDNPILTYLITKEIRSDVRNKSEWNINIEETEKKAKLRIRNDSVLLLAYYANYSQFTLRVKSTQDFTELTFNNGFHVQKQSDDISEDIKTNDNKYLIINDTKKIPKIIYDNNVIKLDLKKDYILLDYWEKDVYVQSKIQQYNEAYLLVFKHTDEIERLISDNYLKEITPCNILNLNAKLYKSETYLRFEGLGDTKPRITFEGGAKKDTGVYSKYWLPQVSFHYAEDCSLKVIVDGNEIYFDKCPFKLDLGTLKNCYESINDHEVDKIVIQLKEYKSDEIIEKELSLDIEDELANINGLVPIILKNVDQNTCKDFDSRWVFQLKSLKKYDWSKDRILIEWTSIADKKGFIPSKKLKQVLYDYLKQAYFDIKSIEDRKSINYVNDLRDPFIKLLQGLGHIAKSHDSKGNFKGIFVSCPYILQVSQGAENTFVLRGMRTPQLMDNLIKNSKASKFEQRKCTMFSNDTLSTIYPTEIYFTASRWDISTIADELNITLVDKILHYSHLELLPQSIDSLMNENNESFRKIDFEKAIDNPLNINADDYKCPVILAYPAQIYLQPNYVIFEKDNSFSVEKSWGIFYVKVKHKMPIFFIGNSWDRVNHDFKKDRLYLREGEFIPEEILNILCLSNITPPSVTSFCIEGLDSSIQKYLKFEHAIDLNLINELSKRFDLKESIINIKNPGDSQFTQILQ